VGPPQIDVPQLTCELRIDKRHITAVAAGVLATIGRDCGLTLLFGKRLRNRERLGCCLRGIHLGSSTDCVVVRRTIYELHQYLCRDPPGQVLSEGYDLVRRARWAAGWSNNASTNPALVYAMLALICLSRNHSGFRSVSFHFSIRHGRGAYLGGDRGHDIQDSESTQE